MPADLSIYLVTDKSQATAAGHDLTELVAAAVAGGATAVQVREKDAEAGVFLDTVLKVAAVLPESVALFVNDRVDVFLAARHAGARVAGVHVGQQDLPVAAVRDLVGPDALIGLTANTPSELFAAGREVARVDYVGIGSVHTTASKVDAAPALGVDGFAALARSTFLPAVAIGGVTVRDVPGLRAAGAAGVAVISAICGATDPRAATAELARAWAVAA
jgi:thiamine-phosphate pyrophosphorylase